MKSKTTPLDLSLPSLTSLETNLALAWDLDGSFEQELKNKEDQSILTQEKVKAISEKLDISEQKLIEFASMPDIEEQLRDRMEALTKVR